MKTATKLNNKPKKKKKSKCIIERSDSDIINDKIDDIVQENQSLKKEINILKQKLGQVENELVITRASPQPLIAQFQTSLLKNLQEWDIVSIQSPKVNGVDMVTRKNDNKNIVIEVAGFYNIVVRYGYEYASNNGTSYHELRVNGSAVAKNRTSRMGATINFNEYLNLKPKDEIQVYCDGVYGSMKFRYNHLTIIKIGN